MKLATDIKTKEVVALKTVSHVTDFINSLRKRKQSKITLKSNLKFISS